MLPLAFGFGGPWDMAILGGIVIVLFGGTKLAGLGKSLGQGIKEFKNATNDDDKPAVPSATPVVTQEPPVVIEAGRRNSSEL